MRPTRTRFETALQRTREQQARTERQQAFIRKLENDGETHFLPDAYEVPSEMWLVHGECSQALRQVVTHPWLPD